ncbi:hypothetical protein C4B68_15205 [Streptomyces dengpaensis]|uniref:Uncharacterized protein n=1 Tax=Streptomyces dengpaensis TaxID=2049881 RepID=A0ABN5I0Y9_9ACTN|nr:hypothetical protein C4B68_15205 [Streptomyces dengpaensis]PIB04742.1 hypothetical protein B1C81_31810 [Streptomyces sp. HG99]
MIGWSDSVPGVWFDADPELEATEEGLRFLTVLRERAEAGAWPCDPDDTYASFAVFENRTELLVTLDLWDPVSASDAHIVTVGAFFTGLRLIGGEFHDQLYTLECPPETLIEQSGSPEFLAERAADWFTAMLALPVLRKDFIVDGRVVNRQWVLARTGRQLASEFRVEPGDPVGRTVQVRGEVGGT